MRLQQSPVVFFRWRASRPRHLVPIPIALLAVLLLALMGLHLEGWSAHASGTLSFAPHVDYPVGTRPFAVAVGDFNGDGKLDLVTANNGSSDVSVLLGKGDGTFAPAVNYPVGTFPTSVAVGDFRHTGKLDLVTANAASNNVSVLLGNGDGTFAPATNYPAGTGPFSVAVGDFRHNGKLDLVTGNQSTDNVNVQLGNGDGTFSPGTSYPVGTTPFAVAVGDLNGDDKLDLAVANFASSNVSVLLGNGDGTFGPATTFAVGAAPRAVAVGDFNGDGKPDLVTANQNTNDVSVLLNTTSPFGDTTPPTLTLPGPLSVDATSPAGAVVSYSVTATDPDNPPATLTIACSPASGSTFPIGTTTVQCTASDPAGNRAGGTFQVAVKGAVDQLNDLITLVKSFDLQQGITTSLDAKLQSVQDALTAANAGNRQDACNALGAFINEAQAQSGNALTASQASQLIAAAQQIKAVLGC